MANSRIQFTRRELEVINAMAGIADAGMWGEGDYQAWDESTQGPYDSLRRKVWALLDRKPCAKCRQTGVCNCYDEAVYARQDAARAARAAED